MPYDNYAGLNGAATWIGDTPIASVRYRLWQGFETPSSLAGKLNAMSTDTSSLDGYSIVVVHVWSMTADDVKATVDQLDQSVEVVDTTTFFSRLRSNVTPNTASFTS
eukprot:CAMPEP_0113911430 /NCGR_PEP_ID=MMETSP0780_2-20120614/28210_1 /TAXON_ID=652834 /ORGANISM="Palpitomonas bilix" /LENGTH=106 /DNA_ID=CAMNT_0000907963 /DNA_START=27 /DNA_END=347 /DNA_ORIENTATION=+ /assembly_acc=CAM_ASM_000599